MDSLVTRAVELARRGAVLVELGEGPLPPLFAAVVAPGGDGDLLALEAAFDALRRSTARASVRSAGRDEGYRLEDMVAIVLRVPASCDVAVLQSWLARRIDARTELVVLREGDRIGLAASIRGRAGAAPGRPRYEVGSDGRVQVEAFELHVAEHCNLRCAHCCNMSPHVGTRFLAVDEIVAVLGRMREVLRADVIKVMGGEPCLHPEIVGVVAALRESGVGRCVRLFTNGLLLRSMSDAFWAGLDELTISNYVSAPVKPAAIQLARERSRRHGFVLNIKEVAEFSQVLSPALRSEADASATFARCWLRHRCLIVRDGAFFMCTRAAYAEDFMRSVAHEAPPPGTSIDRSDDGVPIAGERLAERIADYMNRDAPLGACRYCLGGDGPTVPHHQLRRDEVARGLLSRIGAAR